MVQVLDIFKNNPQYTCIANSFDVIIEASLLLTFGLTNIYYDKMYDA